MCKIGFIHTLMNRLDGEVHVNALFVFMACMQMCNPPSHHQFVSLNRDANERTARAKKHKWKQREISLKKNEKCD